MIRRPFAVWGSGAFAAALLGCLLCGSWPDGLVCGVLGILLIAAGAVSILVCKKKTGSVSSCPTVLLATAVIAGSVLCIQAGIQRFSCLPALSLEGKSAVVGGFVSSLPEKSGNLYHFTLDTDFVSLEGAPQKLKLNAYSLYPPKAGENVTLEVQFSALTRSYGFDGAAYYRSKGIYLTAVSYSPVTELPAAGHTVSRFFVRLRQRVSDGISGVFAPGEAGVARALLLGDKSAVSDAVYRQYRAAGIAHILATSGMHTSILVLAVYRLLRLLRMKIRAASLVTGGLLLGYLALVGFLPSVTRAGLMALLVLLGRCWFSRADFLNSLGFSVTVMVLAFPFAAADVSLQLSACATLGIALSAPRAAALAERITGEKNTFGTRFIKNRVREIGAGIGASLFILPVSMLNFGTVSTVSVVSTLLVAPMMMIALPALAVCALLLGFGLSGLWVSLPAACAAFFLRLMNTVAAQFAALPFAELPSGYRLIGAAVLTAAFIGLALWLYEPIRRCALPLICACALVLSASVFATALLRAKTATLSILPAEKGSCVLIRSGEQYFAFGGSSDYQLSRAADQLRSLGAAKLDGLLFADESAQRDWQRLGLTVENAYESRIGSRISDVSLPLQDFGSLCAVYGKKGAYVIITAGAQTMLLVNGEIDVPEPTADVCILLDAKADYAGTCAALYRVNAPQTPQQPAGYLMSGEEIIVFSLSSDGVRPARTAY